jgi:hypothetical protein
MGGPLLLHFASSTSSTALQHEVNVKPEGDAFENTVDLELQSITSARLERRSPHFSNF